MEGISDLRIIGIDERRPPIIRKEPYIYLFYIVTQGACGLVQRVKFTVAQTSHRTKDKRKGRPVY